jgi:hypothetical protein
MARRNSTNIEQKDSLTASVTPEKRPKEVKPTQPSGMASVSFNPDTSLVIVIDLKKAELIGNTDLLTQTFGHGMTKDIKCDIWSSKTDENGAVGWNQSTVVARTGGVLRYNLAGIAHKIIQDARVLGV